MPFLYAAFAFVRDSWVGKLIAALIGILLLRAYWKHQGSAEAKEYIKAVSSKAAETRKGKRHEIDKIASRPGASDRLRDDWSRD